MICHRLCGILLFLCYMLHFTKASMPVFGQALYTPPKITEGLPPGSSYFTFKATDSTPSDVLTYRLDAKASVWFSIDSSSGVAIVKKTIDREVMTGFFRYKVYASDGTNEASAEVIQEIGEINDNPPLFKNLPKSINISEDLTVGSLVFTASADDADGPPFDRSEYSIESGDKDGTFDVPNRAEGKITLKKPLDYEKKIQYVLTILVKDTGSDLLNDTSVLTINIVNLDDLGAKFFNNLYEATIIKNSLAGTVVTTVQAEDGDGLNASVHYSLYQETNPDNVYKIDNTTGEIKVNGPLNIGTQLLVATATSSKHPPAFTVVKVTVASMLNKSYTVSVAEGQSNLILFNLEITEQSYNITGAVFSIIPSEQSSLFNIDGKNLKLGSDSLDRETRDRYQLNIVLKKDGITKGLVVVFIDVLDINDNKPSFHGDLPYNGSVREDAHEGFYILTVTAKDVDEGLNGTVKYAIIGGDPLGLFSIDNTTGKITLAGRLDRETTAQYNLTVQAYDGGSPPMTNTISVIINVNDINDNSPVMNKTSIVASLPEWTRNGTQIAVIVATDADTGDNGRVTYTLQEGDNGKFVIDPNSGVLTTTGGLSYNVKSTYTIVVVARDNGAPARTTTAVVFVNIEPRINKSYTEQVAEGTANTTVLNLQVVEQDFKVSRASFSFLSGNDGDHFVLDSANNELKVGTQPLDRERQKDYRLKIQVEKDGINRGIAMIAINVLDVNDNAPSFQGLIPYEASIKEDAEVGAKIVKVLATDNDAGDNGTVKYTITSVQGHFTIDNITGEISLLKILDRETTAQYNLTVQAYDGGSPPMTNTTSVIINVNDINDNSPVMNKTTFNKRLSEWTRNGTQVAVIVATDADTGDNGRVTYTISEGDDGKFVIDPNSGVLTTTGGLNYNVKPTYTIVVNARDHGSSSRSATAVVTVTVEPKANKTYTIHVTEGRINELAMNLMVVEQDYNITGARFSISAGNSDGHFLIDSSTKVLNVGSQPLDRELRKDYQLRISLEKNGKVVGMAMINVVVMDANDNSPAFQGSIPYNTTIREDTEIGESILKATAKDSDDGANGTVKYRITAGNEEGFFNIDNITGEISLLRMLDRETTAQFNLTVEAYDGGSPPMTSTTSVLINVEDVNDNSPVINPNFINVTVAEDIGSGVQIIQVSASDRDLGENSKLTYNIQSGSNGKFIIDKISGNITTTGGLSFKEMPNYLVIVEVRDNGLSPRSASALVYITITSAGKNLYRPVFTNFEYLGGVFKDTSDKKVILTVSATDADSGTNGEVTYNLVKKDKTFQAFVHLNSSSGRLQTANSFEGKEGDILELKAQAVDKGSPPKVSDGANLTVYVLRESNNVVLISGRSQQYILDNFDEFLGVLDNLTEGKAFIKSVRPSDGSTEVSAITFNAVDKKELTSEEIMNLLYKNIKATENKYEKWKLGAFARPKVGKLTSSGSLSAVVGAMICLAVLIGVGGIIMIIILLKKRKERERVRKSARVTFNDKPLYINIDGNLPVSKLRHVDPAQEAQEENPIITEETSSVSSEDAPSGPDVLNYINKTYDGEHDGNAEGEQYSGTVNFGTFFPPPPSEPPPPVPDSDSGDSEASEEESIGSDGDPNYINAVLPPHEDFADLSRTSQDVHMEDSPTHFRTESTAQLIPSASYRDTLLHDTNFGFSPLRKSSNPELTTEL